MSKHYQMFFSGLTPGIIFELIAFFLLVPFHSDWRPFVEIEKI